jgi:hypothetical protein
VETINVIIERSKDGLFTAVPQHDYPVGFFGTGITVEEAKIEQGIRSFQQELSRVVFV